MTVRAKICGLNSRESVEAAVAGGAAYVGLMFYPRSPRYVAPDLAAQLAALVPADVCRTAVLVDPDDDLLAHLVATVPLDLLQLHGSETPERVRAVRAHFGLPVMKAVQVAGMQDLDRARLYRASADRLLFDAKPPKTMADALPGGNALAFDWQLLSDVEWPLPWMLSGGLDADNVAEAVAISGAREIDVSSGVEDAPGRKNPDLIARFLEQVKAL